jgi:hypothetical protein
MAVRGVRSAIQALLEEARGIEILLSDAEPEPAEMSGYWDLSMRMINFMTDLEAYAEEKPRADADDPGYLELRRALSGIENELLDLTHGRTQD